jgi:ERCC4-type nuclease
MMRDHIGVFFTNDITDTCNLIKSIYKRLCDNPDKYINVSSTQEQVIKTSITTPEQYFIKALCQIPSVSLKTAKAIADIYKTMPNFINKLLHQDEKLKILKEITIYTNKPSCSKRKIPEKVAKSLIEFILDDNSSL